MKTKKQWLNRDNLELTLLGLPTIIWFMLFSYLPMFGIIIAFKNYKPIGENFVDSLLKSKWVGFDNFKFLFRTPDALIVFRNTILYNVAFIVLGIIVAVTLAIMISLLYSQVIAKFCQTLMFLPHFLSWVVVSYFVFSFLSTDKGVINQLLASNNLPTVEWYSQSAYWPFFIVFVNLWKSIGYSMVVYLASIAGIDGSLYEAAAIDGSSKWQQVRYITIPLLTPIITIMFILAVGKIFMSDFGLFYFVPRQSGPLYDVTQTIDVYVYNALMKVGNIGFASAAGLLQSVFGLVTIVAANKIVSRVEPDNSLF